MNVLKKNKDKSPIEIMKAYMNRKKVEFEL